MTSNPGTGKTHTAIGLGIKACGQGYRVLYTTIPYLVTELKESNSKQKLRSYQKRFENYDLIIVDERAIPIDYEKHFVATELTSKL